MVGEPDSYTTVSGFDPAHGFNKTQAKLLLHKFGLLIWFPCFAESLSWADGRFIKNNNNPINNCIGNVKTVYACVEGFEFCNATTGTIVFRQNQEAVLVFGFEFFVWR